MSGDSSEDTALAASFLGAAGFFAKPLNINEILDIVDRLPQRRA